MINYEIINWLNYKYDNLKNRDYIIEVLYNKLINKINLLGLKVKSLENKIKNKRLKYDFLQFMYLNSNYFVNYVDYKLDKINEISREKFEDLFGLEIIDLYREIDNYIDDNGYDLLKFPKKNYYLHLIYIILNNVEFKYSIEDYISDSSEDEFVTDEDFYDETRN